jgi:hypothetical protein
VNQEVTEARVESSQAQRRELAFGEGFNSIDGGPGGVDMSDRTNLAEKMLSVDKTAHASPQPSEPDGRGISSDRKAAARGLPDDIPAKSHSPKGMEMIGSQHLPPTSESKQRSSDQRPASEDPRDADSTFDPSIDEDLASPGASVAGEHPLPPCDATWDFCPENGSPVSDVRHFSSADDLDSGPLARALEGTIVVDGK